MTDPSDDLVRKPFVHDPNAPPPKLTKLPFIYPPSGEPTDEMVVVLKSADPGDVPEPATPAEEVEPAIERHDPFAYMRGAKWMNRKLSPQGRAARRLQEELEAFPVLEGREPKTADIDAMAKRVVDYMVPIFRREQLTDMAYDILEEKRQARISARQAAVSAETGPQNGSGSVAMDATASTLNVEPPHEQAGEVHAPEAISESASDFSEPSIARFDDGTSIASQAGVATDKGKADVSTAYDEKGRIAGLNAVFADGHRVESRWSYDDAGRASQVDTVRGASGEVRATITTTFDGQQFTRVTEPAEGPAQTETWNDGSAAPDVHKAALPLAPVAIAAIDYVIAAAIGAFAIGKAVEGTTKRSAAATPAMPSQLDEVLPSGPLEMRIASSSREKPELVAREVPDKEAETFCPNLPEYDRLVRNAANIVDSIGSKTPQQRGQQIHDATKNDLKKINLIKAELDARGLVELSPEQPLLRGDRYNYRIKGSSVIDIYEQYANGTVCIYDIKTGNARYRISDMARHHAEARAYFPGATRIFVIPIQVR